MEATKIEINNLSDLVRNIEHLKDKIFTNYSGEILVYDENSTSPDYKFIISNRLFSSLDQLGYLEFIDYTISHRAVRNYKLKDISKIETTISAIEHILKYTYNKNFKSLKEAIEFIRSLGYVCVKYKRFAGGSYWGGNSYDKCLAIKVNNKDNTYHYIYIDYIASQNIKTKSFIHRDMLRKYCKLFNIEFPTLNNEKYKIRKTDNGNGYIINKKLWESEYNNLSENIMSKILIGD